MVPFKAFDFDPDFARPPDWAAMYRGLGWNPVPAYLPTEEEDWKRPVHRWREFEDRQVPDATFDRWYGPDGQHRARANMGTITGAASDQVFCLDLDSRLDGRPDGIEWFFGLIAVHNSNMMPETPHQRTGGGGHQFFFRAPAGWVAPTIRTPGGIDIRGQGGFAMLPPSRHQSGRDYTWEPGSEPWAVPVLLAPPWLIEAIDKLRAEFAANAGQHVERTPSGEELNVFGLRVDGREERMRDLIWGVACDLRREFPGKPDPARVAAERERVWQRYLFEVKTRIADPTLSNEQGLEREGRGRAAFIERWDRALGQWDGKLLEAAGEAKPDPFPVAPAEGVPIWFDPFAKVSVPPFPLDLLPPILAAYVEHQAKTLGADPAGIAVAALTTISGTLDQRFVLKMRRTGEWYQPPRLWAVLVGESATKKTPIMTAALKPLRRIEYEFWAKQAQDTAAWNELEKGDRGAKPPPPTRFIVNDTTVEAVSEILTRQARGLLVVHDELSSFVGSLDRYSNSGSGGDRAFWLMAHNGGPMAVDRVGKSKMIENLCVAFLGGTQPGRFRELEDLMSDGLTQRFLPVLIERGSAPGDLDNDVVVLRYADLIRGLIARPPQTFYMTDDALVTADEFNREINELEDLSEGISQAFCSWVGKLPGYHGSLSTLLHVLENRDDAYSLHVGKATVERARRLLTDFFIPHGRAFYQDVLGDLDNNAEAVASFILTDDRERYTISDLQSNVRALGRVETQWEMRAKLAGFVSGGWLIEDGQRAWNMAAGVREKFADKRAAELERKARITSRFKTKGAEHEAPL